MAISDFTADHIGKSDGSFEPQRGNNILLFVNDLAGAETLTLSLQSFPLPKISLNPVETPFMNQKRKFAGTPTFEDITAIFNDYVDQDTSGILWRWFRIGHDPKTGKNGLAKDYKKTARAVLYSPEGSIQRDYFMEGLWISNIDPGEGDMSSDEQLKMNITFSCDKAYPKFDNYIDIYAGSLS